MQVKEGTNCDRKHPFTYVLQPIISLTNCNFIVTSVYTNEKQANKKKNIRVVKAFFNLIFQITGNTRFYQTKQVEISHEI